jgi:hypothetical protein
MDLNYQLNERRAYHEKIDNIIPVKKEKKIERIEKTDGFKDKTSLGEVKINFIEIIPFEEMNKLPSNTNGYIDQDGNFYSATKITSNTGNDEEISMNQFTEAFILKYLNNSSIINEYKQLISGLKESDCWGIFNTTDEFLINRLGFAKFYRYIDNYEYGTTCECSRIPDNYSAKQLIMMRQLFTINHNLSTNIIEKGIQYSLKLSKKI